MASDQHNPTNEDHRADSLAIALDLGTSGLRAQALDLRTAQVIASALTLQHPLPGANVLDHLHLAVELGVPSTRAHLLEGVRQVVAALHVPLDHVRRLAVCGNPVQLSLLQGLEVRDLAYPGRRKQEALRIVPPAREAVVDTTASVLVPGLPPDCTVVIPPAVTQHVGADALALVMRSGLEDAPGPSFAIDYGTNAEMALSFQGRIFTGSTPAGPALEGQHVECGMLAAPGALVDVAPEGAHHRLLLLDARLEVTRGPLVSLREGTVIADEGLPHPIGITGTGVVALAWIALQAGLASACHILTPDRRLHAGPDLFVSEADLAEVGKAVGAVRAGYLTLCHAAGVPVAEVTTAWIAGASGTHVDPTKARNLGLLPPAVREAHALGNTSLAVARALALSPTLVGTMGTLATRLRETHCSFATSSTFTRSYLLELSHWTEGMPMALYRSFLKRYGLPDLPPVAAPPVVAHVPAPEALGTQGPTVLREVGSVVRLSPTPCTRCRRCVEACPQDALALFPALPLLSLALSRCLGVACRRCERACPNGAVDLLQMLDVSPAPLAENGPPSPAEHREGRGP